jgi:hypothetical protein
LSDQSAGDPLVFEGHLPPLVDRRLLVDIALPFAAAGLVWAIQARDHAHDSVDPAALILTVLALLVAIQALFGLVRVGRRLALAVAATKHRLTLARDQLLLALPGERIEVPREAVWGVSERGHWGQRSGGGERFSPVYVVTDPARTSGRTHLVLPPVFGEGPGMIAEALMRWAPSKDEATAEPGAPPGEPKLKSRVYDDAASGARTSDGVIAIHHGCGWLTRGPYITALLGLALVLRWLQFDEQTAWLIGPEMIYIVFFGTLMVPLAWILLTLRELRPRKNLAFVLTDEALLIRTRRGVLDTPLGRLGTPRIDERIAWSAIRGVHRERTLILPRADDSPIRYEEAFLGVPAEVALILLTTKRRLARGAWREAPGASEAPD